MRVAHLLRKYDPAEWGGTETAIHQLTSGLTRHAVESIVYSPRLAHAADEADPLAQSGCESRRFHAWVPVWGATPEQKRQMTAVGGNLVSVDLVGSLWRERGLDLVHSHALGRLGAAGLLVARGRNMPFVLSVHGGAYDLPAAARAELRKPMTRGCDWGRVVGFLLNARQLFARADAIVTCNPREAALISERHPGRRIIVQPHGVPADRFGQDHRPLALEAFPQLKGKRILLLPGRIDPVKNQGWVVSHAAELSARHADLAIVLVGACTDPAYGEMLRDRISRDGLDAIVFNLGRLPPGDPRLIGLMQQAAAVVLPSVSETFGLVILEAWAAHTPVIATRTSGARALIEEGRNGFLFDLDQPAAFHAAAACLLTRPDLRREFAAAGHARVLAEFDTTVLAGRMKALYDELKEVRYALRHHT